MEKTVQSWVGAQKKKHIIISGPFGTLGKCIEKECYYIKIKWQLSCQDL
jgi:hypothetical protein